MRNLVKGILVLVTGACLALTMCTSFAASAGNVSEAANHHTSKAPTAGLQPDTYALTGPGLHVTYDSTGFWGMPQLTYRDQQRTLHFSGSAIRRVDTDAGTLVSVTTIMTVDTGSTTFSLLIPRVTVQNWQHAQIRTFGITTRHRLTIDTPAHGQLDTYQIHPLTGTASFVVF
jgi:hypothetical protein